MLKFIELITSENETVIKKVSMFVNKPFDLRINSYVCYLYLVWSHALSITCHNFKKVLQGSPRQQHLGHIHAHTHVRTHTHTHMLLAKNTLPWLMICFAEACVGLLTCLHMSLESKDTNGWASIVTRTVSHPDVTVDQEKWHTPRTTCQTKHMSYSSTTLLEKTGRVTGMESTVR